MHPSVLLLLGLHFSFKGEATRLLTNINEISKYWGHLSPYTDNPSDLFGVEYTGLPAGCQIESVQVIQRHTERFPTFYSSNVNEINRLTSKLSDFKSKKSNKSFEGILSFLNSWQNIFSGGHYLTGPGAASQFAAGVDFWNKYGRILYNASSGQLAYDPNFPNGTARPTVVLRTTEQSRIYNSQINWALGFFGSTWQKKPNPSLVNATQPFKVLIIPEESKEKWNNTLAPYISCSNFLKTEIRRMGKILQENYVTGYIGTATERLQKVAPDGLELSNQDVFAMQLLCAYETAYIGNSEFCQIFTEEEWASFDRSWEIMFYNTFGYGNPTGRAQGIGYVQEILARLNHSLISSSSTSVNSTLDGNPATFPTSQAFYADFSHDDVIISILAALSIEYFHTPPNITQFPINSDRKFRLSNLAPFGARLVTETIGCNSANPKPRRFPKIFYEFGQDGYNASKATHKFVRMRLNNGIVPLNTIRGGICGSEETGRIDGMCALKDFLSNQEHITALANYQYACFANYKTENLKGGRDYDGTIFPSS
ncbi:putative repressible acid phosphatase [Erysiphe necator]|uniref:Putative repressible acid phosphatase n=1 Tax=Uncinula necator TaxID=52586 RepID=A0A0B1P8G0_UNCNE|nr:putative repressible acid phosphatase [Erysiphe necator]